MLFDAGTVLPIWNQAAQCCGYPSTSLFLPLFPDLLLELCFFDRKLSTVLAYTNQP